MNAKVKAMLWDDGLIRQAIVCLMDQHKLIPRIFTAHEMGRWYCFQHVLGHLELIGKGIILT